MLNYIISVTGEEISSKSELMGELENKFSHIKQLSGVWHLSGRENETIYKGTRAVENRLNSKDVGILEKMFKNEGKKIQFYRLQEIKSELKNIRL